MEFLIFLAAIAIAAFIGYKYYQAKSVVTDTYALPEAAEVKVGTVEVVTTDVVEAEQEEVKKTKAKKEPKAPAKAEVAAKRTRKGGKFVGDDKSTADVNEAFKDGKAPAKKPATKKKPTLKVEK